MTRNSSVIDLVGACVAPFLDAALFDDGGYIPGRFCAPVYELPGDPICCLPCPSSDWAYSDKFITYGTVAEWMNVAGLILMVFMLLTYIVLPAQQTRSHYLSVSLVVSIGMVTLGFTIPLAAKPEQCYNEITPNGMYTSPECAWSGALIIAGGLCAVMWIFIRALSMNLQICWDIMPGKKFFYASQIFGWGVPAAIFAVVMTLTGVSFRFGSACYLNHADSMADFWGPLLGLAGLTGILQMFTFAYCLHVYLRSLWSNQPDPSSNASGGKLPSNGNSVRRPRAVYRRLRKVLWLQWRGICIVIIILVDVVFFSVVFVYMDGMQNTIVTDASKWVEVKPWLTCLVAADGDKEKCLSLTQGWLINENIITAVLFMLSLAGVQVFLLLTRPTVFPAWWDLMRSGIPKRREFISLDAKPKVMRSNSTRQLLGGPQGRPSATYEMQPQTTHVMTTNLDLKGLQSPVSSPDEAYKSPLQGYRDSPSIDGTYDSAHGFSPQQAGRGRLPPEYVGRITPSSAHETSPPKAFAYARANAARQATDYFTQNRLASSNDNRRYFAPQSSFSSPTSPSREGSITSVNFEPRDPYTRGGLSLNPPSEAGQSIDDRFSPISPYQRR